MQLFLRLLPVVLVFVVGCSGLPSGSGGGAFVPESPPSLAEKGLRIATLNAYFLYDGRGDEGQIDFPRRGDSLAMAAHRARVGGVLRAVDADVVVLQEVGNRRALELLVDQALEGMGYSVWFVEGRDRFTGQDVGLLARVPVDTVGRTDARAPVGATRRTYGVSKNLFARLQLGDVPVTVVGVHFLARPDDAQRAPRRNAQAEVIRQLVEREAKLGRAVAVMGDLNDFDDRTLDVAGHRPISDVLATIKRAGPGDADDLVNVLADVPPADRFTAHYDRNENGRVEAPGELSAIDHVLLSPTLYRHVRAVTYAQFYDPTIVSDHFPIVVTLQVEGEE